MDGGWRGGGGKGWRDTCESCVKRTELVLDVLVM